MPAPFYFDTRSALFFALLYINTRIFKLKIRLLACKLTIAIVPDDLNHERKFSGVFAVYETLTGTESGQNFGNPTGFLHL